MTSIAERVLEGLRRVSGVPGTTRFYRSLYKQTRPGSGPFISGDGFRLMADHAFDETNTQVDTSQLRPGAIVFIATHMAEAFLRQYASQIRIPYTIVTHNSDLSLGKDLVAMMGENVVAWFAQNCTCEHERVAPIPIGLENLHHYHAGIPSKFSALRKNAAEKKNRILVSFNMATNPAERSRVHDVARTSPLSDCIPAWLDQNTYMRTLSQYRFVLSPPGHGLDTHRTWEAMYLGVVPIVGDSVAMRSFAALGLPIWIVAAWSELKELSPSHLEEKYEQLKAGFMNPALYLPYWERRILARQPFDGAEGQANLVSA